MLNIHILGNHLSGLFGLFLLYLAALGVWAFVADTGRWLTGRYEWDRPSWRPWTWRAYRRWFAPGQLIETDDHVTASVLDVDLGPTRATRTVVNTWLYVQPHDEHDDQAGPPCWLPLADTLPAAVGPFADDTASADHTPTA